MIAWDIINSMARLAIGVILVWKLLRFGPQLNRWERHGMALGAGCSILTISVIWEAQRSPFDGWASSLFSIAMLSYFIGRYIRLRNRARINEEFGRIGIRRE